MTDRILTAFLERQRAEGMALAAASDLLELMPIGTDTPQRYIAVFRCTGLVELEGGEIAPANHFAVGIWFPDDYLRVADPFTVVTWLGPQRIFQPNIAGPFICLGRLSPGTSLVDILYRCYEIITYDRVTMREDNALNREACVWARRNMHRFPTDRRPLKRCSVIVDTIDTGSTGGAFDAGDFEVEVIEARP